MTAAGGARAFFKQRKMTIALLNARPQATADLIGARVLASVQSVNIVNNYFILKFVKIRKNPLKLMKT